MFYVMEMELDVGIGEFDIGAIQHGYLQGLIDELSTLYLLTCVLNMVTCCIYHLKSSIVSLKTNHMLHG